VVKKKLPEIKNQPRGIALNEESNSRKNRLNKPSSSVIHQKSGLFAGLAQVLDSPCHKTNKL
jgi:hypothetical protein